MLSPKGSLASCMASHGLLAIALGLMGVKQVSQSEWWKTPTCQSRIVPQPDGTSIAYRC